MTSKVVEHLLPKQSPNTAVAYFYCDKNQEQRRKPDVILRTFIKQLAINVSDGGALHKTLVCRYKGIKSEGFSSNSIPLTDCGDLLVEMASGYEEVFLLLDALDETDDETRDEFLDVVESLVSKVTRLKVFISSRRDSDIKTRLENEANIGIEKENNHEDITQFVRYTLEENERKRRNPFSADLKRAIVREIEQESDGMSEGPASRWTHSS